MLCILCLQFQEGVVVFQFFKSLISLCRSELIWNNLPSQINIYQMCGLPAGKLQVNDSSWWGSGVRNSNAPQRSLGLSFAPAVTHHGPSSNVCGWLAVVVQGRVLKHCLKEENEYCLKLILKAFQAFLKCGIAREMANLNQFCLGNHFYTLNKTFKKPYILEKSTISKWLMLMDILALHRFFYLSKFHLLQHWK